MASGCISPDNLLDCSQTYAWLNPRLSLTREMLLEDASKSNTKRISSPPNQISDLPDAFEFRLEDPVTMLPADQLFSDGKLVPLQSSFIRHQATILSGVISPDTLDSHQTTDAPVNADRYMLSPRAPKCSSRWKELFGFGKLYQSTNIAKQDNKRTSLANGNGATKSSIRQLLQRGSKSAIDPSVNLPLLKDSDNESVSMSFSLDDLSLSSSSSGHDLDDLPRLSLDSDKPGKVNLNTNPSNRPKTRMVKTRRQSTEIKAATRVGRSPMLRPTEPTPRGVSVDSPRMNSSGKIVFHSLERSSSSPSSLNGGPRFKHRGMERSYSANVRVTPVLNVSVCSLSKSGGVFGFPIFSSQQKRGEGCSSSSNRSQRLNGKGRSECG